MDKQLILVPRLSEKTYGLSEAHNTYTFAVPTEANKHQISRAVAAQYGVVVQGVKIVNQKGKTKRTVRKGRAIRGQRSDIKKAYVTLKEGEKLPIFAALEEEKETDKKAAKKAAKETK